MKGRILFFTYYVIGKKYESSLDAPDYDLCTHCKFVVRYTVSKIDYAYLETYNPLPDSINLIPPTNGWPTMPLNRDGADVVVKEEYKGDIQK